MGTFDVHPLTRERWDDFTTVFGANGAYDGCWCMYFRQTSKEYSAGRGDANREAIRELCEHGREPGLIGYIDWQPSGWVSVAPRAEFGRILRSPLFRPSDPDRDDVWSVVCLFIAKPARGRGLAGWLVTEAVKHARRHGATRVDAYPINPEGRGASELYHGTPALFRAAGFEEVARPNDNRVLMSITF
ncbi:MAG: GNAT family N-acetyltransferase [Nitriliruptorales bacterium]|nr:GNAT family N-acetyltransferase [Nitriliruptorales bacterium]